MLSNISYNNLKTNPPLTFGARTKLPKTTTLNELTSDVVELSSKKKAKAPERIELTENEKAFEPIWMRLHTVEMNIRTQKEALRHYYSANDKYEYQELLKERRNLTNQLRRMAKKEGRDYLEIGYDIDAKKSYNRYAKKVLKTSTQQELNEVREKLAETTLFAKTRALLTQLVEDHKKTLTK